MIKNMGVCAGIVCASTVLMSSAVAQANPSTPIPVIESSASQLYGAINAVPTTDGVMAGLAGLQDNGLDEIDGAMVLITAIHHVCPQHQTLLMGVMGPAAAAEVCNKPL